MKDIVAEARKFESEEIGQMYLVVAQVRDWQKETNGTLDELLDYMDKTFPKKKA